MTVDTRDAGVDNPEDYAIRVMFGGPRNADPHPDWFDFHMRRVLSRFNKDDVLVIEGGALGIDTRVYEWAKANGYAYKRYFAEWDKYQRPGKKNPAGMIRNVTMLKVCTHYVAMWDGVSPGTGGAIREAVKLGVKHHVIKLPRR
jgi:hypothetical protein